MAGKNWNLIDDYKIDAPEYYCAFIDILGYKNKSHEYFEGRYNLYGRLKRALDSAFSLIESTQVLIDISELEIKFISDSIIIFIPRSFDGRDNASGLFHVCTILSSHLSMDNLFVRGGISFGAHEEKIIHHKYGFEFISSLALQEAYILESKYSIYPRILVDKKVVETLSQDALGFLIKEKDNYIVHFAHHLINRNGDNQNDVLCEMNDIYSLMNSEIEECIIDKYKWLLDYYYWTLTISRNINLSTFSKFEKRKFISFELL